MNETYLNSPIPINSFVNPTSVNEDSIMQRRWDAPDFKAELLKQLAGLIMIEQPDGTFLLQREDKYSEPLMNYQGAKRIIQIVNAYVNSPVSLSNISDEDANTMINSCLHSIIDALAMKGAEYGIRDVTDQDIILETIKPIVFCQAKRPVNGHESRNSRTTTSEVKQESFNKQQTSSGFNIFGGKKQNSGGF